MLKDGAFGPRFFIFLNKAANKKAACSGLKYFKVNET